jgi:hypothetical protein
MLLYILWPVFRFTSDFGGRRYVGRNFCRFFLAVFNAELIARTTINKYRIIQYTSYIFDLRQIFRNECIMPPNSVATAPM